MKTFFMLFLMSSLGYSKVTLDSNWVLQASDLEYTVNFPLKTIKGHNNTAKGKALCQSATCEFLVGAEVVNFDSGDRNRDLHMRETTKAALFPVVSVRGKLPKELLNEKTEIDLDIEFAGVKKHYSQVPFRFVQNRGMLDVSGSLNLSLKDFGIQAPSLLGVSIDDLVPLKIETHWEKGT